MNHFWGMYWLIINMFVRFCMFSEIVLVKPRVWNLPWRQILIYILFRIHIHHSLSWNKRKKQCWGLLNFVFSLLVLKLFMSPYNKCTWVCQLLFVFQGRLFNFYFLCILHININYNFTHFPLTPGSGSLMALYIS